MLLIKLLLLSCVGTVLCETSDNFTDDVETYLIPNIKPDTQKSINNLVHSRNRRSPKIIKKTIDFVKNKVGFKLRKKTLIKRIIFKSPKEFFKNLIKHPFVVGKKVVLVVLPIAAGIAGVGFKHGGGGGGGGYTTRPRPEYGVEVDPRFRTNSYYRSYNNPYNNYQYRGYRNYPNYSRYPSQPIYTYYRSRPETTTYKTIIVNKEKE